MPGLAHVFLHVGLCSAIARASRDTQVAMRVRMSYQVGGAEMDKVFKFERGDGTEAVIEFDAPRSVYHLQLDAPKYNCATSDFLDLLADRSRNVAETLSDGPAAPERPMLLLEGTAPISFLYVKPTFVLFDPGAACGQPVSTPLPSKINVEYDQGAYYVQLYLDSVPANVTPVLAIRLRMPTGAAHYVHLPVPFSHAWGGSPNDIEFNISEDMIDGLATEKVETLLCPKLWETRSH